jgi:hypothetical protein
MSVTAPTLAATSRASTGNSALFADSGLRDLRPGRGTAPRAETLGTVHGSAVRAGRSGDLTDPVGHRCQMRIPIDVPLVLVTRTLTPLFGTWTLALGCEASQYERSSRNSGWAAWPRMKLG